MPNQIVKPTAGRIVILTDREGRRFAGLVDKDYNGAPEGRIDINYFDRGQLRFAEGVPYSADAASFSYRLPIFTEEKITV